MRLARHGDRWNHDRSSEPPVFGTRSLVQPAGERKLGKAALAPKKMNARNHAAPGAAVF